MFVARRTAGKPTEKSGIAASRVWCQEVARRTSDRPIRANATATQPRSAEDSVCPTLCRFSCEIARTTSPATSAATTGTARRRAQRQREGGRAAAGAGVSRSDSSGRITTAVVVKGCSAIPAPILRGRVADVKAGAPPRRGRLNVEPRPRGLQPRWPNGRLARVGSFGELSLHVLRARRTAACARAVVAVLGIVLVLTHGSLSTDPMLAGIGFAIILASASVQFAAPRLSWMRIEESLAAVAAVLIIGLGGQRVTALSVLWLCAVAAGVLSRGGRVHWFGRALMLGALALPIARDAGVSFEYACLCVGALSLLLTCGRLTRELSHLLEQARHDADHDDLTGALSRSAFRARLDIAADPTAGRSRADRDAARRPRTLRAGKQVQRPRRRRRDAARGCQGDGGRDRGGWSGRTARRG